MHKKVRKLLVSYVESLKSVYWNLLAISDNEIFYLFTEYLSDPRLSFTVYHDGSGYYANISCRLAYGSPPVTFQLLLNGKRVDVQQVNLLEAWFSQPVTIGLNMGSVQCIAENDIQQLLSNSVNLEVGG